MTSQLRVADYVNRFQGALTGLFTVAPNVIRCYSAYNANAARDIEFIVWYFRNIHQDVYTGSQTNKGIDRPIFQINVFTQDVGRAAILTDVIVQAWHGYSGNLNGISVGKADVDVLLNTYDEEASRHQVVLEISMQVAVPTIN